MRTLLPLLGLSFTVACTAQPPSAESPFTLTVGAAGGGAEAEGVRMDVPAGAVDGEVTLTAFPTDRVVNGVVTASPTWTFGPDGQVFATPITVSLAFTGSHDGATLWWTKEGDTSTFTNLATVAADGWAAGAVAHFSEGVVGEDDQCGTDGEEGHQDEADDGDDEGDASDADDGDDADGEHEGDDGDDADGEHEGDDGDDADGEHEDGQDDQAGCQHEDHQDGDDDGGEADDGDDDGGESED
jgi:hypothetical protein